MKVFVDVSIISAFLKGELDQNQIGFLETTLLANRTKRINLITLEPTKEKINKISRTSNSEHLHVLKLLSLIKSVKEIKYCSEMSPGENTVPFDPLYEKLINILDNLEARQVYQAMKNNFKFFLTVNSNIIKKKKLIENNNFMVCDLEEIIRELIA